MGRISFVIIFYRFQSVTSTTCITFKHWCEVVSSQFLKSFAPRLDLSSFNIQRYLPGEHFQSIHSERSSLSGAHRLFAWMTYLNDVSDGGATTCSHFGLDIQPRAGKTMIWPAEWTHAHAGQVLNAGKKYIITGWMHFPPSNAAK